MHGFLQYEPNIFFSILAGFCLHKHLKLSVNDFCIYGNPSSACDKAIYARVLLNLFICLFTKFRQMGKKLMNLVSPLKIQYAFEISIYGWLVASYPIRIYSSRRSFGPSSHR